MENGHYTVEPGEASKPLIYLNFRAFVLRVFYLHPY
jgi:hypothetical protein